MKRIGQTLAMLGTAAMLSIAVANPGRTYDILTTPTQWAESKARNDARTETRAYWDGVRTRADEGDTDAMYRLALEMKFARHADWTGVSKNLRESERLMRAAADRGDLNAKLTVWSMDGSTADGIREIVDHAFRFEKNAFVLYRLSELVEMAALDDCDSGLRDAAGRISDAVSPFEDAPSLRNANSRHEEFLEVYRASCQA